MQVPKDPSPVHIEILTVGDELLDGRVVDTNSARAGARLTDLGHRVQRVTTAPDTLGALTDVIREIAGRADVCLVSGGLGPTVDDLTVDALAAAAGVGFDHHEPAWQHIVRIYGDRTPPESNRRQCRVPHGGRTLATEVGTAPGVELTIGECTFYALPGVPHELDWHLERHLLPALDADDAPPSKVLTFAFVGESDLAASIEAAGLPPEVSVTFRARGPINDVRFQAPDAAMLTTAFRTVINTHRERYVPEGDLAAAALDACRGRGLTLGAAESCTGGLLGARLTTIPGASEVFAGAIVSYSNAVKQRVLGVSEALLAEHGAVSEPCAAAMAAGAREALGVDLAVAITGVAGPGGGTVEKPVGTVCFAWSGAGLDATRTHRMRGDRDRIRNYAVAYALDRVRRGLKS